MSREEEMEYEILGNSEVNYMRDKTEKGERRGIYSTSGAGIVIVLEHIENKMMKGRSIVIHEGGDDIKELKIKPMFEAYKEVIKKIKYQGELCIVSGILPRKGESSYWSSRAIGINKRKLYAADGMHLSRQGTKLLSVIVEEKVDINSNLDKQRKREKVT